MGTFLDRSQDLRQIKKSASGQAYHNKKKLEKDKDKGLRKLNKMDLDCLDTKMAVQLGATLHKIHLMSNKNLIVGELNNNPMPKSRLIDIVQGINYDNFGMSSIKSIEEALAELKNSLQIVYVASNDSADPTIYLTSQYGKLKQKQVS